MVDAIGMLRGEKLRDQIHRAEFPTFARSEPVGAQDRYKRLGEIGYDIRPLQKGCLHSDLAGVTQE